MATQALYRRWRPQTFDDVIGQDHVTQTLRNALASGRVAHAYLFTGPRGTGKTSVARILAKAVNCLAPQGERPCNACRICEAMSEGSHLDLIEIDAASNTGVDDVRDLRDKINFAPNEARQKVYVVDEVHMLSNAAFNALLKTLEEPPPHALFVLATTEPHKIPETIRSRCQRFDFRRVGLQAITGKLERICEAEGVRAEPAALEAIARAATGSLRDSESLLDQLLAFADDEITLQQVEGLLGSVSEDAVADLVDYLIQRDLAQGIQLINAVVDAGADPRQFTRQVLGYLQALLLLQTGDRRLVNVSDAALERMRSQTQQLPAQRLVRIIRCFAESDFDLKIGAQPQLPLELAFVEVALGDVADQAAPRIAEPASTTAGGAARRTVSTEVQRIRAVSKSAAVAPVREQPDERAATATAEPATAARAEAEAGDADPTLKEDRVAPEDAQDQAPSVPAGGRVAAAADIGQPVVGDGVDLASVVANWEELLTAVRPHSRTVEALLKDCKPVAVDDDVVTLGFFYAFHRERVEEPKNKALIAAMLKRVLGKPLRLRCVMVDKNTAAREVQKRRPKDKYQRAAEDPVIQAAIENLGARIVSIESNPSDSDDKE